MALNLDPEQWLHRLVKAHDQELPELQSLNNHFEGTQPLNYLHPELVAELEGRLQQVVINWPELVVDCLDERLDLTGFRISGQAEPDANLEEIWQYNDLDDLSQQAHVDALVMRRAFSIVGSNDDEDAPPIITMESPLEVHAEWDPRTREVAAAVKRWTEDLPEGKKQHATLYLPNRTTWYVKDGGRWVEDGDYEPDEHNLGMVPVVPIVNRPRLQRPGGKSELASIIPISNAANKIATDMMVSAEFHAMPRRWALGFGPEDFEDEQGRPISTWRRIAGRIWATSKNKRDDGVEVGQFAEADLQNFHRTINLLAQIVGSLGALTPQAMGLHNNANPATADAIRAAETRLVKRAERRHTCFGSGHERTMRIADRIRTGVWRDELRRLESQWRDASTPTEAQSADAAVKKYQAGITPLRQTREDLRYTPEQIRLMEEEDERVSQRETERVFGSQKPAMEPEGDMPMETERVA